VRARARTHTHTHDIHLYIDKSTNCQVNIYKNRLTDWKSNRYLKDLIYSVLAENLKNYNLIDQVKY